jgi:hypothetical protein
MKEKKTFLPGNPRGMRGFFAWLGTQQPGIARAVLIKLSKPGTLGDLGIEAPTQVTTTQAPVAQTTADKIKDIVLGVSQAYLSYEQMRAQKKVLDMQLQRAQTGLPPLDLNMEQYGLTGPQVSVGLSPQTRTMLIYGGIGLAAVFLLPKLLGKRG